MTVTQPYAEVTRRLHDVALRRALDEPVDGAVGALTHGRFALQRWTVDLAVDAAVRDAAHTLLTHGWTPAELHAFAARRLDERAMTFLRDAMAAGTLHGTADTWPAALAELGARVWWTSGEPHLEQWARRYGVPRRDAIRVAVEVLALLAHLPRTDDALPGMPSPVPLPHNALVQDERIVGRIDALLGRAGRSEFAAEAAACTLKAQELMIRYATVPVQAVPAVAVLPLRVLAGVATQLGGVLSRLLARVAETPMPARAALASAT